MTVKYGVIVKENQEHVTSVGMFLGLLALIEIWFQNESTTKTLGIILDQWKWSFDEYSHPNALPTVERTVSIQSYANDGEQHFPKTQFLDVISRCRELVITPMHPEDDCIDLVLKADQFFVITHKAVSGNPDQFYPISTTVGHKITND